MCRTCFIGRARSSPVVSNAAAAAGAERLRAIGRAGPRIQHAGQALERPGKMGGAATAYAAHTRAKAARVLRRHYPGETLSSEVRVERSPYMKPSWWYAGGVREPVQPADPGQAPGPPRIPLQRRRGERGQDGRAMPLHPEMVGPACTAASCKGWGSRKQIPLAPNRGRALFSCKGCWLCPGVCVCNRYKRFTGSTEARARRMPGVSCRRRGLILPPLVSNRFCPGGPLDERSRVGPGQQLGGYHVQGLFC